MVSGVVRDYADKAPLAGVTVRTSPAFATAVTGAKGSFSIRANGRTDSLIFTLIGYAPKAVSLTAARESLIVEMEITGNELQEVKIVNTGYQKIPRERATGSFNIVSGEVLNRMVSTNIIDRLENNVPGLLFNHGDAAATDPLLIRGRSTITANAEPLIVLDDFPYDGDLSHINPNDIESISVLKDAAAASVWGARAGNGVIVITTKRGKTAKPLIAVNSNVTFQGKPDLFSQKQMSPADAIDLEKYLFSQGRYSGMLSGPYYETPLTPVAELLLAGAPENDARIEAMKEHDVRTDLQDYFYRTAVSQQHSMNVSGNGERVNYYLSAGYDRNLPGLVASSYNRVSLRSSLNVQATPQLRLNAVVAWNRSDTKSGNNNGYLSGRSYPYYPYARLADDEGNPLPVYLDYPKAYLDTAGHGLLQDWTFKPLEDIRKTTHENKVTESLVNAGAQYTLAPGLNAEIKYQYENQPANQTDLYRADSYYTRNLVNRFAQLNASTGDFTFPIPAGGILDEARSEVISHQGRLQVNFDRTFSKKHRVTALAGYEIRSRVTETSSNRYYGYDPETGVIVSDLDYHSLYSQNNGSGSASISTGQGLSRLTDHFLSWYSNASYSLNGRYVLSGSFRKDEANLFGVRANEKGTPLWSLGAAWTISDEKFFHIPFLTFLKLRSTYGVNGNVSRLASAYTTALFNTSMTGLRNAFIQTPPNENLRWEKVKMFNAGLDFGTRGNVISGTAEYYVKNAADLLASVPTDPTLGFTSAYANVAGMQGRGFDLQLNSNNLNGRLKWQSNLIFSFSKQKVTRYLMPESSAAYVYLSAGTINPVIGKPLYSVYSFRWAGLDPQTGDPLGYFNGIESKDYSSIYTSTPLDSLRYHGPLQPVYFGSFRNTFSWKSMSLSFTIAYQAGAFFRTTSVYYQGILKGWGGHSDFSKRWQRPGDEKDTYVPSMVYPNNDPNRDNFYANSAVLVQKSDNIRLSDISLNCNLASLFRKKFPFSAMRLYLYASNLGVIWKANKLDIDPYFNNVPREGKKIALGTSITF